MPKPLLQEIPGQETHQEQLLRLQQERRKEDQAQAEARRREDQAQVEARRKEDQALAEARRKDDREFQTQVRHQERELTEKRRQEDRDLQAQLRQQDCDQADRRRLEDLEERVQLAHGNNLRTALSAAAVLLGPGHTAADLFPVADQILAGLSERDPAVKHYVEKAKPVQG